MQRRFQKLRARLTDTALRLNLIRGHEDYKKFIILGIGRSGSNLLASSLRSHDNVVSFGEIFNNSNPDRILWEYPGYKTTAKQLAVRRNFPCRFIDEFVFKKMPAATTAVGFKLFYYHAREPEWQSIWEHLQDINVYSIHLKRRNLLRLHLSMKVAFQTGKWSTISEKETNKQKNIVLDYDECLKTFTSVTKRHQEFKSFFKNQIDIYYEDLVSDYASQMTRVQDFLGVPRHQTSASTKKQSRLPLSDAIENYSDLKQRFADTEWAIYFDE